MDSPAMDTAAPIAPAPLDFSILLSLEKIPYVLPADLVESLPIEEKRSSREIKYFGNSTIETNEDEDGRETNKIAPLPISEIITDMFIRTEGWPKRINNSLFIHEPEGIHWIDSAPALFGWLSTKLGVIEWRKTLGCVTKEELYNELCRRAEPFEAIEMLPHFPKLPDHYYACEEVESGNGDYLDKLINFFSPATDHDRMLILAMFVTPFWGGKPGSRPAFLVTSDKGRGVGKSTIAAMVARLANGFIELRPTEDASRMYARLLSANGLKLRIARLDNVKTMKFSWAELEAVITSPVISGHRLHKGEASRPNNFSLYITLNGASLSIDMAQRVIIVKLKRPADRMGAWESDVCEFIDKYRAEIIADICNFFTLEPDPITEHTRWAAWEDQVLGRLIDPMDIKALIEERSNQSNVESEEVERMEEFFLEQLQNLGYPSNSLVHIPTGIAASWYTHVTGEKKGPIAIGRMISQACTEGHSKYLRPNPNRSRGRGFVFSMCESFHSDDLQNFLEVDHQNEIAAKDKGFIHDTKIRYDLKEKVFSANF